MLIVCVGLMIERVGLTVLQAEPNLAKESSDVLERELGPVLHGSIDELAVLDSAGSRDEDKVGRRDGRREERGRRGGESALQETDGGD